MTAPHEASARRSHGAQGFRYLIRDRAYCAARHDQTLIVVWRGETTVAAIQAITASCEELLAAADGPATYIAVLERTSPAPSEPVRRVLARWSREVVPGFACAVIVAEGGGFRAALVRGVGVALTALVPHRVPFVFAGSAREGVERLAPFLLDGCTPVDLSRSIERTRAGSDGL